MLTLRVENGMDGVVVSKETVDFSVGTFYSHLSLDCSKYTFLGSLRLG